MLYRKFYVHFTDTAGETTLYTKISDGEGRKALYPDVLQRHEFQEGEIRSDALYELALETFSRFAPHRIYFFGVGKDHGRAEIFAWLDGIADREEEENPEAQTFTAGEAEAERQIAAGFHLTASMGRMLRELLIYGKYAGKDLTALLSPYVAEGGGAKQRGKEVLEEIRKKLVD
ncbi:MAG: hypothetical protein LBQ97_09715 [Fusobacteriaceae bacterium]|jgi:hypothetical protein|nr:hypothetical protein [Fusobacteriaceae bacterium]